MMFFLPYFHRFLDLYYSLFCFFLSYHAFFVVYFSSFLFISFLTILLSYLPSFTFSLFFPSHFSFSFSFPLIFRLIFPLVLLLVFPSDSSLGSEGPATTRPLTGARHHPDHTYQGKRGKKKDLNVHFSSSVSKVDP